MKIKSLGYSTKEAFKNLWRNQMMSVASITSVCATLIILGIIYILIINVNNMAESVKVQFDTVLVYLSEDLTIEAIEETGQTLLNYPGVKDVQFVSKNQALEDLKLSWNENAYLLDGLESNPLPNSYVITLSSLDVSRKVVENAIATPGVTDVKYYQDIIDKILKVTQYIRWIGLVLIAVLIGVSTFIIANTIKLAVTARRKEINIMKYVGATNWFIRWPFLLEGTLLGIIGASIAAGIIYLAYRYTYNLFTTQFYVIIAAHIVSVQAIMGDLIVLFVVLGSGIGALGSINAMRKHLNV